jgi:hypothetical protein
MLQIQGKASTKQALVRRVNMRDDKGHEKNILIVQRGYLGRTKARGRSQRK